MNESGIQLNNRPSEMFINYSFTLPDLPLHIRLTLPGPFTKQAVNYWFFMVALTVNKN